MYTSPKSSGYSILNTVVEDNGIGLHLGSDGAHPTVVCGNLFTANNEFEGAGGANGIYSNEGARKVLITANRFERHNTSAIFADIDEDRATPPVLQQDILVEGNTSVDDLSFAVVYNSSRVRVTGNDISARVGDKDFPGPASAIRIGARSHDVEVDRNRVRSASGNGIDVTDSGEPDREESAPTSVLVLKNKVQHAKLLGIDVSASGVREYEVRGNRVLANGGSGIHLGPRSDDALVTGNTALGNGVDDGLRLPGRVRRRERDRRHRRDREHLAGERGRHRRPKGHLQRPRRRRPARRRRQAPREEEAPRTAAQAVQGPQAGPPGPLRVHPPLLAVLTAG
jgi:hypothetical protein